MKIKKIMLGVLAIGAVVSLAACSSNSGSKSTSDKLTTVSKGQLTVAISPDYPPFEYKAIVNGKDSDVGIDIDIAKAIAKQMDLKLNISNMSFDNVLGAVSTGKADIAISGITITKEREKSFDFSDGYYTDQNQVIIKKSDLSKYNSLSDFKGTSLAAQTGSTQVTAVQTQIKGANLVQLTEATDEINEVKAGKIAGTVMDSMVAKSYVAANSDLAIAKVKIPVLPYTADKAVAMKKGSKTLKEEVNAAIKDLKKTGKLDKIIKDDYAASQKTN